MMVRVQSVPLEGTDCTQKERGTMKNSDKTNTWDDIPRCTLICSYCSKEYRDGDKSSLCPTLCEWCIQEHYPHLYERVRDTPVSS